MIKYTIPLGNFDRQKQSTINLGDAKVIASENLAHELFEYIMESFAKRKELVDLNPPKFYLQMDLADAVLENDETRRRPLDRALVLFKLFKDGLVKSNIVFIQQKGVTNSLLWRHYVRWTIREAKAPIYILNRDEETSLPEFWREFVSIDPTNFAVYRFHLADFRPYLRDRFVDYVESMEYLLVPDSGEGDIGYKFRTRGALVLGAADERQTVHDHLKGAYDLRSAIVHGNSQREAQIIGKLQWENVISPVRHYDRRLIVLFYRARCINDSVKRRSFLLEKVLGG